MAFGGRRGCTSTYEVSILISELIHDRGSPENFTAKVNVRIRIVFLHPFKDFQPDRVFHLFVTISRFPKRYTSGNHSHDVSRRAHFLDAIMVAPYQNLHELSDIIKFVASNHL